MGKDKFENEDLIRYGFLEDFWSVRLEWRLWSETPT